MSMTIALMAASAGLSMLGGRKAKSSAGELAQINLERLEDRFNQNIEMINNIYDDNLRKMMYENTLQRFNYTEATTDQLGSIVSDIASQENAANTSYAAQEITENNDQFARNINNMIIEEAADYQTLANTKYNQSLMQSNSYQNSMTRLSNQLERTERTANNMILSGAIKGALAGFGAYNTPSADPYLPDVSGFPNPDPQGYPISPELKSPTTDELYDKYFPTYGWV